MRVDQLLVDTSGKGATFGTRLGCTPVKPLKLTLQQGMTVIETLEEP